MKIVKIIIAYTVLATTILVSSSFIKLNPINRVVSPGFAVIELYTSEGCSSCPPADELVSRIQKEMNAQPVYILAFHVDYWNRLGWKDTFSNADYSKRQHDYARYLKTESVYTPQIIVNGKKEFIGSQEGSLRNAIKWALQSKPEANIVLSDIKTTEKETTVHYDISGISDHSALLLALVEKSARSVVKAGENSGRTLSHVQIVRNLQSININKEKSGATSVILPNGVNSSNYEVIALLQNTLTGEIRAATKAPLTPAAI